MSTEKSLAACKPTDMIQLMKHLNALLISIILCVQGVSAADAFESKPTLTTISWLSGTWTSDERGRQITEQWMSPAGGTMLGMSRTVSRGRTVEYEFLLLRSEANGEINYVAKPSGQAETAFKLIRASATEAVFENPQHDFPQRVIYTLKNGGKLMAAIEGTKDGKTRRVEFNYERAQP
jgi:hypothetical protein